MFPIPPNAGWPVSLRAQAARVTKHRRVEETIVSSFIAFDRRSADRWAEGSGVIGWIDCRVRLASKHALNERCGFRKSICTCESRYSEHHVIHGEAAFCVGALGGRRGIC